jgi:hypothetical protein
MRTARRTFGAIALAASVSAVLTAGAPAAHAATPIPNHVYAPYFETWTSDGLRATADASGAKYFTLAFLETTGRRSCTLAWNGSKSQTVAAGRYLSDIASLRSIGGDVIPSFGGWSADQGGTEIGDSCQSVSSIVDAYKSVVTTYDVTRLDMDIEGRSLTRPDGIDRRNKAIAQLQQWAAGANRPLEIQYTLPTNANGLGASSLAVLQNAVANGVRIDIVNPMVFDYYDRVTTDMGAAAISASNGLHGQLATLLPGLTSAQIWARQGATMMNGVDDYPKGTEVTTVADAQDVRAFAQSNGMRFLSIWSIQRDRTGKSGITQQDWDFTHALATFTGS